MNGQVVGLQISSPLIIPLHFPFGRGRTTRQRRRSFPEALVDSLTCCASWSMSPRDRRSLQGLGFVVTISCALPKWGAESRVWKAFHMVPDNFQVNNGSSAAFFCDINSLAEFLLDGPGRGTVDFRGYVDRSPRGLKIDRLDFAPRSGFREIFGFGNLHGLRVLCQNPCKPARTLSKCQGAF